MKSDLSRSRGMTLIELLAALVISGFVMAMAGRVFLSGNAQFIKRSADSERLSVMYRIKADIRGALQGEVARCEKGGLWLKAATGEADLLEMLRKKEPGLAGGWFRCLEIAADGKALQEWRIADQPPLVEYGLLVRSRGGEDSLSGSWIQ